MNRLATLATLIAAAGATTLAQSQTFVDQARVQSVEAQYEQISVPRQECTTQYVTQPRAGSANVVQEYAPAVIGGVAGAALGRQVGGGSGRTAATVLGAVAGAYAGNTIATNQGWNQPQYEQRPVQQCQTVNDVQNRLTGYRVSYEYRGQRHTALMAEQPGKFVPLRVSVEPMSASQAASFR